MDDVSFILILFTCACALFFVLELYVVMVISSFLASFFGFNGILWWVCALLIFSLINGVLYKIYRIK